MAESLRGEGLEIETIRVFARDVLNLSLTEAEAVRLTDDFKRLSTLVEAIERVPLPFLDDPFVMPTDGDAWLDAWPEENR